jgi:hypothetical protein
MRFLQLAEQRDGLQARNVAQQRQDFALPDLGEWIGASAPNANWPLGRQLAATLNAPRRA